MKPGNGQIFYEKYIKGVWPYWAGAVILGLLNVLFLYFYGRFWSISAGFAYWGGWLFQSLGVSIENWPYFNHYKYVRVFHDTFFDNTETLVILGMISGAFLSALAAGEFRIRKIKSKKHIFFALAGGFLMGYGARMAFGCNIGAYLSAVGSMSLHGWIFGIFAFLGALGGSRILIKYFL
ncbi:MAG: YeeE/YedE family protein [Candidatus Syntrophonatronum acetioxidans]|uniref:YeeE/YedE family protein n=1 Tax=Candidatus Syntrophonatronum acetioxidans TaxID=1795816 RepID=A0A424YHV6_9FIRM|nr:MAG: YeeE/YedE family protein [Candidatus Syntrophonatronum acetioxidans]